MISTISDKLTSLLFPQICLSCGMDQVDPSGGNACYECWNKTQIFNGSEAICEKCGLLLGPTKRERSTNCWQCNSHYFDKARACGIYSEALATAVIGLKMTPKLSPRIEKLLDQTLMSSGWSDHNLIVPVPLSRQRRLERGFNQAEVIATATSRSSGIAVDFQSLQRTKHSPMHRVGMDRKARDLSVKNAFEVARPKLIAGQRILLVDDVYTTGATLSYCAKALKKNGAIEVNALTIARAVTSQP